MIWITLLTAGCGGDGPASSTSDQAVGREERDDESAREQREGPDQDDVSHLADAAGDGDGDGDADVTGDGDGAAAGDGDGDAMVDDDTAGDGDGDDSSDSTGGSSVCGDGMVDGDEACDTAIQVCCNADCAGPSASDVECREQLGVCDAAEYCDGARFTCPVDGVAGVDEVCREAVDECDVDETCDGETTACPLDAVDHCTNVIVPAGLPRTVEVDTSAACSWWDVPECDASGAVGQETNETVLLFTPPATGLYAFDSRGSTFDTALYVFDSPACDADVIACNNDVSPGRTYSLIVAELTRGITVPLALDGMAGASGDALLNVVAVQAPGSCDEPQIVAELSSAERAFTHLGGDRATPSCGGKTSSPEAVFSFTAAAAGTYSVSTQGSSFDTVLAVLAGDACDGEEVGCSDDLGEDTRAALKLELAEGATVLIIVEGKGGEVGAVELEVELLE